MLPKTERDAGGPRRGVEEEQQLDTTRQLEQLSLRAR